MPVNLMPVSAADSTALSDESIVGGDGGVDETGVSNSRARLERPLARPAGPRTDYDGHFRAALDRLAAAGGGRAAEIEAPGPVLDRVGASTAQHLAAGGYGVLAFADLGRWLLLLALVPALLLFRRSA